MWLSVVSIDNVEADDVLESERHSAGYVLEHLEMGEHSLCPVCRARLIVALMSEAAKAQRVNPGMRCPVNARRFKSAALIR